MKIAIVANDLHSVVNFRGALLQELVARGHRVTSLAPAGDVRARAQLQAWQVAVQPIPMSRAGLNPLREWATLRALRREFARLQPDLVLSYTIKAVVWGCLAAKQAGVARIYSLMPGLGYAFVPARSWKPRLVHRAACFLYRRALPGTQGVIFQNPDDERLFRKLRLLSPSLRTTVVHGSGVDLAQFPSRLVPPAPVFLLMARLIADKGIHEYWQAARKVKQQIPGARFLLAGDLDENPSAVTQANLDEWQADGVIEYLGHLDDVRDALAGCSVYVLPSYYREGVPRSILEALATGRAVITTDSVGCRETVQDGVNGLLVPPRDADVLAAAVLKLAQDGDLRERMGKKSLALARQKFDVHKVNQAMLAFMGL